MLKVWIFPEASAENKKRPVGSAAKATGELLR
jgi:hypothetical protein